MENGHQEPINTKEIVIFHVFFDNLFFDSISDVYDSLPNVKNLYYYYPQYSPKFEKIKNTSKIKLLQNEKEYLNYLKDPKIDVILFHSLNCIFYKFFKYIDRKKLVIWWAWGYDLYNTIYTFRPLIHIPNMVKPITLQYMTSHTRKQHQNNSDRLFFRIKTEIINPYIRAKKFAKNIYHYYIQKIVLSRIDLFYSPLEIEYDYLKSSQKTFRATQLMDPHRERVWEFRFHQTPKNILIGHSLTYTDNHLDIFIQLKKIKIDSERKYIIPVNYGIANDYDNNPENLIKECPLQEKQLMWIKEIMPFNEYQQVIGSVTHAIIGVVRQQALGNIYMCIRSGVKVFLYKDSMVYKELKKKGYIIFSIEDDLNEDSLNSVLTEEEARFNFELFKDFYLDNRFAFRDKIEQALEKRCSNYK